MQEAKTEEKIRKKDRMFSFCVCVYFLFYVLGYYVMFESFRSFFYFVSVALFLLVYFVNLIIGVVFFLVLVISYS